MLSGGGIRLARRRNTINPQARSAISLFDKYACKRVLRYVMSKLPGNKKTAAGKKDTLLVVFYM